MDLDTRPAPSRRHVLIGTGVVIGCAALAAVGVHSWRGSESGPSGSHDSELDALAGAAVSGGPGKDGIPAIDGPRFVGAGKADFLSGPRKGTRLTTVPLVWTTWRAWRIAHPDTLVLSTDTGALRDYGTDPYGSYLSRTGYYFEHGMYFPVRHISDHYDAKEIVVGVRAGPDRFAILKEPLVAEFQGA